MGGMSSSQNSSSGESYGYNLASSDTDVWGGQQGPLGDIYSGVQGMLGQQANMGRRAAGVSRPLQQAGGGFLENLQGLGDPSAQIAAQSQGLQQGLGDLFANEINPALRTGAIGAGGLGGSRLGVAQGAAAGQLGDAYTQGLGDIYANANQQAMGASLGGMAALPGLYDLGMNQYQAAWAPYAQASSIIGGPTVLSKSRAVGEQRASNKSKGSSFGMSISPIS